MRVRHGAVALDVSDDAAGSVPNLDAPPVAGIINVSDFLPMRVHDVGARRGATTILSRPMVRTCFVP